MKIEIARIPLMQDTECQGDGFIDNRLVKGTVCRDPRKADSVPTSCPDPEFVKKQYITDYTSIANRDIIVYEEGSYIQRYVYGLNGESFYNKI